MQGRQGPQRAVQSGVISTHQMKNAMRISGLLSFCLGIALLYFANLELKVLLSFLLLGLLSIWAAIAYTNGKRPYGYEGFGDISVFIFFGIIAVLGTYYLQSQNWQMVNILPAVTCGFFSMAVLNINNIRDIESDLQAGKFSIPVKVGRSKAVIYHAFLLFGGLTTLLGFILINYESPFQFLPMLVTPLIIKNYLAVKNNNNSTALDPYLKQMALTTLLMVLLFGVSIILK